MVLPTIRLFWKGIVLSWLQLQDQTSFTVNNVPFHGRLSPLSLRSTLSSRTLSSSALQREKRQGHDRSPSSLLGWTWESPGMGQLLAKTGFLSLGWCEAPPGLAAGGWVAARGQQIRHVSGRDSTSVQASARDGFLASRVSRNQCEARPSRSPHCCMLS